jgi:hypothetical protein
MMTVVKQYLAVAFVILIGLMASSCGDSATVNPEATLANLTVTTGTATATLEPSFNPETRNYTVNLSNNITSVTITAQPAVAGDTVSIDDQTTSSRIIDLGPSERTESTKLVSIVVSNPPSSSRTYSVLLKRAGLEGNNSLATLTVSPGTLNPSFNPNTRSYTADVANNVVSVTVTPTLQDTAATMTVNGQATTSGQPRTISLNGAGQSTTITITVTAQNGSSQDYLVTVSRGVSSNNDLQSLAVSPGALNPTFNADRTSYTVNVASSATSVTVTPRLQDTASSMTVNGQATTSGQARSIQLGAPGSNTPIIIVVTAQNGTQKVYTVGVERAALGGNNNLSGLIVSPGTLAPTFDSNTLTYSVDVANNVESISVTPTRQDSNATITVNGQTAASGQARTIILNPAGQSTNIVIVVTAQNGNVKNYLVTVSRGVSSNNNLQSLTVSPGTLNPTFSANRTSYTVNVASGATEVTVTPRMQDAAATMTINGQATNSGQARTIQLGAPGSNTPIFIIVTAQNGTQKTYTVGVTRAALGGNNNLSALTVSPGTLNPAFNANTLSYTVDVASSVTSVSVTPTRQDSNATITVNGQATDSGQSRTVALNGPGSNTVIPIVVTAPNGSQKTYTVNVSRAALGGNNNLSALTVSPGSLSPSFSASRTSYTVSVGSGIDSVTVTATKADSSASMTINGQGTNSGQARSISLGAAGTSTEIDITVTAPNGDQKIYAITVNRAALGGNNNLSALTVSPGSLSPSFNANTTGYTSSVSSNVASVTVTATLQDTAASMTVNGQGTSSGQARDINLGAAGTSTEIDITVTAPNGSQKTYSITVNRSELTAPPAPASAPDLIPEDDSCPRDTVTNECLPGTSDADNITNVNTPRFRIAQPGTGETPSLHVDGNKVDSTFNQAANTLQPTAALSDGDHEITYTVTTSGGESSQSPSLTVTIDTVAPGGP